MSQTACDQNFGALWARDEAWDQATENMSEALPKRSVWQRVRPKVETVLGVMILSFWAILAADMALALDETAPQSTQDVPATLPDTLDVLSNGNAQSATALLIAQFPDLFERPAVLGIGDADAPIRVIKFFDYKCSGCKKAHKTISAMVAEHPQLRVEFRQLPIMSKSSETATRFAFAVWQVAGEEAYREVHELLFGHKGPVTVPALSKYAAALGLDLAKLEPIMSSDDVTARIEKNRAMAAALGLRGTPAFVTPRDVRLGARDPEALARLFLDQ